MKGASVGTIGIVSAVDSELASGKSLPEDAWERLLARLRSVLESSGMATREVGILELATGNGPGGITLQLTLTESIEESRSGDELLYRTPVTSAIVWVDDSSLAHGHREKLAHSVYSAYSEDAALQLIEDMSHFLVKRLKRRSA